MPSNLLYGQAGGVTPVINASACGVIQTAREHPEAIGKVIAAEDGVVGALRESLYDLGQETDAAIESLYYRPGGAFGACRYDLGPFESYRHQYERLIEVFATHDIGYFLYNGGGGSMVTAHKIDCAARELGYPLTVMGIPKTIDNDLLGSDASPGFGTTAKYVATAVREATLDVHSMASTSTKVFILEVMGRNAGWLAAASGLAAESPSDAPHIILFAERPFDEESFIARLQETVERVGYCVVVASEGVRNANGDPIAVAAQSEVKSWVQLGGIAPTLAELVRTRLGHKVHWALPDYLQRAVRHVASTVDVEQAYAVGKAAVEWAVDGKGSRMPVIERLAEEPYRWQVGHIPLAEVADIEAQLPAEYITEDGYGITDAARRRLLPLIEGETYPPYKNGLPDYGALQLFHVERRLPEYELDEQAKPE